MSGGGCGENTRVGGLRVRVRQEPSVNDKIGSKIGWKTGGWHPIFHPVLDPILQQKPPNHGSVFILRELYLQFDWKNETGKKEFKDSPLFIGEF